MRKLASIQCIDKIVPIEGADRIECAHVLGWKVIVRKGEFKEGGLCIYVEIDSVLPEHPEFEFMRPRKFKVKTIRMRGQLSQGICFSTSILHAFDTDKVVSWMLQDEEVIGSDVTEVLGITKYEPPEPPVRGMRGPKTRGKRGFPSDLVPKTDETRIQSVPKLLEEMQGIPCYITVKEDGTSAIYVHNNGECLTCSRNCVVDENSKNHPSIEVEENIYTEMEKKYDIHNKLRAAGNYAVQGEIVGPGIQKNRAGYKERKFLVFNVWDVDEQKYLGYGEFINFCQLYELEIVELWKTGVIGGMPGEFYLPDTIDDIIALATGQYSNGYPREGIVIRPFEEKFSRVLSGRMSFKVVNNDYLLKEEN